MREDLRHELTAMLGNLADRFFAAPGSLDAILDRTRRVMSGELPIRKLGSLTITAGEGAYDPPADAACVLGFAVDRGDYEAENPWSTGWPGRIPVMRLALTTNGEKILLSPLPTQRLIDGIGSTLSYWYGVAYDIEEATANLTADRHDLFLLRALAECMRDIAAHGVAEPVQLHRGMGSTPANATPAAMYRALMDEYERERALH